MRFGIRPEGLLERIGVWLNLGPFPVAEALFGMATSRALMAAISLGFFAELAGGGSTPEELAARLSLDPEGVRHLLHCMVALGHVRRSGQQYVLTRRARRWLDPNSRAYVGASLEFKYAQWEWWSHLEDVLRTGKGFDVYAFEPDDPRWRAYITAMFQHARLTGPEIAQRLRLPAKPQRLLDLGGGHGWFAAEFCRRHPSLRATVLDLPDAARVGREIIAQNGMSERVAHVEGDILQPELGGPYDAVLCFQTIHPLTPQQNADLFRRIYEALVPGGTLAVLDYFKSQTEHAADASAFIHLNLYLTSGAPYTAGQLRDWLRAAGFAQVRRVRLWRQPLVTLFEARK